MERSWENQRSLFERLFAGIRGDFPAREHGLVLNETTILAECRAAWLACNGRYCDDGNVV